MKVLADAALEKAFNESAASLSNATGDSIEACKNALLATNGDPKAGTDEQRSYGRLYFDAAASSTTVATQVEKLSHLHKTIEGYDYSDNFPLFVDEAEEVLTSFEELSELLTTSVLCFGHLSEPESMAYAWSSQHVAWNPSPDMVYDSPDMEDHVNIVQILEGLGYGHHVTLAAALDEKGDDVVEIVVAGSTMEKASQACKSVFWLTGNAKGIKGGKCVVVAE